MQVHKLKDQKKNKKETQIARVCATVETQVAFTMQCSRRNFNSVKLNFWLKSVKV